MPDPTCPRCGTTLSSCEVVGAVPSDAAIYCCLCGHLAVEEGDKVTWYAPMAQTVDPREVTFRAKRIDLDLWVEGHYFRAPITDENSGAPQEAGWFFLAGPDEPTRHLIESDGVANMVDPATLCTVKGERGEELALLRECIRTSDEAARAKRALAREIRELVPAHLRTDAHGANVAALEARNALDRYRKDKSEARP